MDARSFDVRADDLPAHHMVGDHVLNALSVHVIIQSSRTARTRESRKPAPQRDPGLCGEDLSYQDVGSLRASPETTLPVQLSVLSRTMRLQHVPECIVEYGRSTTITTFGPPTNHDLETTNHGHSSVTGLRRHVNQRLRARHDPSASREPDDTQISLPSDPTACFRTATAARVRAPAAIARNSSRARRARCARFTRRALCRRHRRASDDQRTRSRAVYVICTIEAGSGFNNPRGSATTTTWIQPSCRSCPVRAATSMLRSRICERRAAEPAGSNRRRRYPACSISSMAAPRRRRRSPPSSA